MIFDSVSNMDKYFSAIPGLKTVKEVIDSGALKKIKPGLYETGDKNVRYNVMTYTAKNRQPKECEIHKKEIDVQILLKGNELMKLLWRRPVKITGKYDRKKDFSLVTGKAAVDYHAIAGVFAIFFPGEPHAAMMADGKSCEVLKVVFKIAVSPNTV
jgi:YhcH/YjgK/YiaL family protein